MGVRMAKYLPLAPLYRVIKDAGAERVSDAARETLAYHLEKFASEVSKYAVDLARHAKRKTVTEEDIELAVAAVWKK
jgi:histone H3/H4